MTLKGIIQTPEQEDDYYRNKGPIPPFQNEYGCIQDVIGYNATLLQGITTSRNTVTFSIIFLSVSRIFPWLSYAIKL